ncbi:hypothetical protein FE236_03220 [Mariprofundus erugo]|uniref:hypothetical protein n=1 Tax=Mariprofundus erugo TaxID=2528639 RepID=UPI0010FF38B4|nr:hypothetical protein [Mariprofundus erugo]TLS77625.1 hypothetical protein FE236_03220 [Mariprofundus erugo]
MNYMDQALERFEANGTQSSMQISQAALLAMLLSYQVCEPINLEPEFLSGFHVAFGKSSSMTDVGYMLSDQQVLQQFDAVYDRLLSKSEPLADEFRVSSYDDMWSLLG